MSEVAEISPPRTKLRHVHCPVNMDMSVYDFDGNRVDALCGKLNFSKYLRINKLLGKNTVFEGKDRFESKGNEYSNVTKMFQLDHYFGTKMLIIGQRATGKTEIIKKMFIPLFDIKFDDYAVVDSTKEYSHIDVKKRIVSSQFPTGEEMKNINDKIQDKDVFIMDGGDFVFGKNRFVFSGAHSFIITFQAPEKVSLFNNVDVVYFLKKNEPNSSVEANLLNLSHFNNFDLITITRDAMTEALKILNK